MQDFQNGVLNFVTVSEVAANTPYMLLPDKNDYLLQPDAPVRSAAMPRAKNVTVKDGTRQACHIGTYQTTTDVTTLLASLSGQDGYVFILPGREEMEESAVSPTLQPFDASLVITGDASIASQSFEIRLDGTPTAIDFSQANDGQGQWYNLSGQQVVNGKGQAHGLFLQPTGGSGYRKVLK